MVPCGGWSTGTWPWKCRRARKAVTFQIAYWTAPESDPDGKTAPLFYREPEIDLAALSRAGTWRTLPASGVVTVAKPDAK